jgi:hypothetical protein
MTNQEIFSRYEYPIGNQTANEVFEEYRNCVENKYREDGAIISGVFVSIREGTTVIALTHSKEAETFLRLKFYGRKDVRYNKYY